MGVGWWWVIDIQQDHCQDEPRLAAVAAAQRSIEGFLKLGFKVNSTTLGGQKRLYCPIAESSEICSTVKRGRDHFCGFAECFSKVQRNTQKICCKCKS